jgi:Na+-translocating ferredoxin:NAD+ oxidoreductase RnfD subunit
MRKSAVLLTLLLALTLEAATSRKVMSVTHITAVRRGNAIYTTATGEVNSGGWTNPRLTAPVVRNGILTYQFTATPPGPNVRVIQMIVEVQADAVRRGAQKVRQVRVNAAQNSMTVDVQ